MYSERKSVFETNSSSTHSMTLRTVNNIQASIPIDCPAFNICESVKLEYNKTLFTECDKLRYLVALIAEQIIADAEDGKLGDMDGYYSYWGEKGAEGWRKFKDVILNHKWVVWLTELVKEKCNTDLVLHYEDDRFPYISYFNAYDDCYIFEVLGVDESKLYDEKTIKNKFEDIIFNPLVVIEDKITEW